MITLYTIGFTKKSACEFFELLKKHSIKTVVDVRISNNSQLAGFAKGPDLTYFLKQILYMRQHPNETKLKPIYEAFDGTISYDDIRFVIAALN